MVARLARRAYWGAQRVLLLARVPSLFARVRALVGMGTRALLYVGARVRALPLVEEHAFIHFQRRV